MNHLRNLKEYVKICLYKESIPYILEQLNYILKVNPLPELKIKTSLEKCLSKYVNPDKSLEHFLSFYRTYVVY